MTERRFHPLLSSYEPKPGEWWLQGPDGDPYAIVNRIRRGDEVGYRAVLYAERDSDREHGGYYRRLIPATVAAHERRPQARACPQQNCEHALAPPAPSTRLRRARRSSGV